MRFTLHELNSEPEPDVAVVIPPFERYDDRHPYAEEIYFLIEVAERSLSKDTREKLKIYAQAGIPEYWVININVNQMIVYREPFGESYRSKEIVTEGTILPLAFPNVAISVDRLLGGSSATD